MSRGYRQVGLTLDGETILLQKFRGNFACPSYATSAWLTENRDLLKSGLGLDIETTGLDRNVDRVIEIATRPFHYRSDTGEIVSIDAGYSGLEDPGVPLTPEIVKITGITGELLRGQKIDWNRVGELIAGADVIVAHHARFDRPFVDSLVPASLDKVWACSFRQVDWSAKGFPVQQLGALSLFHGFFVDAHRAMNDVNAMLYLLTCPDPDTGAPYSKELFANCMRPRAVIYADRSPYDSKDILKAQGYRWNAEKKSWYRSVTEDGLEAEIAWLTAHVYGGAYQGTTKSVPCVQNFGAADPLS
jgi:DNA polymerase-3 subunit epsilon